MITEAGLLAWEQEDLEWAYRQVMRYTRIYQTDSEEFAYHVRETLLLALESVRVKVMHAALDEALAEQKRQHRVIWKTVLEQKEQDR